MLAHVGDTHPDQGRDGELLFERLGLNKRESKDMVEAFFDVITRRASSGDEREALRLRQLLHPGGTPRPGRDPRLGEAIRSRHATWSLHASHELKAVVQGDIPPAEEFESEFRHRPQHTVLNGRRGSKTLPPIPAKRYFTIGEVSELCGVKAVRAALLGTGILPTHTDEAARQPAYYQHHEVVLIRRIRELLYEQGFTISGARNRLDRRGGGAHERDARGSRPSRRRRRRASAPTVRRRRCRRSRASTASREVAIAATVTLSRRKSRQELLSIRGLLRPESRCSPIIALVRGVAQPGSALGPIHQRHLEGLIRRSLRRALPAPSETPSLVAAEVDSTEANVDSFSTFGDRHQP